MNIGEVKIEGFRGLNISTKLKRINIVVGENGSGKTSFLESIFASLIFQSDYAFNGGVMFSIFSSLSDSKITLDDTVTHFKKVDPYTFDVKINNEKVAEIKITSFLPTVKIVKKVEAKYSPVYIPVHFDISGIYVSRGLLKRELIRLALTSSDILLIDEIEDSLHPDTVVEVLKDIKDKKNTQVIFTTNSNEVIKMSRKILDDDEVQVIYLSRGGYKVYEISEISEFEKPLNWLGYI